MKPQELAHPGDEEFEPTVLGSVLDETKGIGGQQEEFDPELSEP